MVTALDQPSDIDRAVDAKTDDFLTKPINKTELLIRVNAALNSRQHKNQLDRALAKLDRSSTQIRFVVTGVEEEDEDDVI